MKELKFRIKERKYKDGSSRYLVERKFLFFWIVEKATFTEDMILFQNIRCLIARNRPRIISLKQRDALTRLLLFQKQLQTNPEPRKQDGMD